MIKRAEEVEREKIVTHSHLFELIGLKQDEREKNLKEVI